jgi:hypothetical protein
MADEAVELVPAQLIYDFAADVIAGKVSPAKVLIVFLEPTPEGRFTLQRWWSGGGTADNVLMLEEAKRRFLEEWAQ